MRRERRSLTRAELGRITSPDLVIRKVRRSQPKLKPPSEAAEERKHKEGER
jgi:hypothetical protein